MVRNMKRKSAEEETPSPAKSSKFSLELFHDNKRPGTLYELELHDDIDLRQQKPLMEHVVDVKATNEDLVILDSNGKVFLRPHTTDGLIELDFPLPAIKITTGVQHAACLLEDGQVFIWGGFENPVHRFRDPYVQVLAEENIVDIASGRDHLVAINEDGKVFSMGCGAQGQLGRLSMRVAKNGGRKGPSVLWNPQAVHMNKMQCADKIWATKTGTFYRDAKSKAIYGCGENTEGTVSPVERRYKNMALIFHPVKTLWSDVREIGESLVLLNNGTLLVPSQDEETVSAPWEEISKKASSVHFGHDSTHFINKAGDVFEFKRSSRIPAIYVANDNKSAKALGVAAADKKWFLLVD